MIMFENKATTHHFELTTGICNVLSTNYHLRRILQKAEFTACWILLLVTLLTNTLLPISILYIKVSVFTRLPAYSFDFANAWVKCNRSLPMWLLFHHGGVVAQHFINAFFFTPNSPLSAVVFLLVCQSSHNSWTKRYSLALYWCNVLVGVVSSTCYQCYFTALDTAGTCSTASFVLACVGVILLGLDSVGFKLRTTVGRNKSDSRSGKDE